MITAEIHTKNGPGFTATLVREDEKEDDMLSLIDPLKKFDTLWKDLEK